ncbi:MAG TPA: T9SS type A sorting domain-containing protein, partial [Saprospiraceae bacterium]
TVPLTVYVYNSMGELILTLPEVLFSSGEVNCTIDLADLSAGVYTLRAVSGNELWTRKVVVAH